MKETAAPAKIPYANIAEPADAEALTKAIVERIHALFGFGGAGDAKKLWIVQGSGLPAWKAFSGDATLDEAGVITIGGEKISTAKLAALCVTEAKIALEAIGTGTLKALAVTAAKLAAECVETGKIQNLAVTAAKIANETITNGKIAPGAVSSDKHKPTQGRVGTTGEGEINSEVDLELAKLEITPVVASKLLMIADLCLEVTEEGVFRITWKVGETKHAYQKEKLAVGERCIHRTVWSFELPAATKTTIALCVSRKGAAGKAKVKSLEEWQSGWNYLLVAA